MSKADEIWIDIKGHENKYQISKLNQEIEKEVQKNEMY